MNTEALVWMGIIGGLLWYFWPNVAAKATAIATVGEQPKPRPVMIDPLDVNKMAIAPVPKTSGGPSAQAATDALLIVRDRLVAVGAPQEQIDQVLALSSKLLAVEK